MRVFNWKTGVAVWLPGPHDLELHPVPPSPSSRPTGTGRLVRPHFRHDPALTVLTLYLKFQITTPRRVVNHDQYAAAPSPPPAAAPPRDVPWAEWGPAGTRLVHPEFHCTVSPFGCSVAQTRWTTGPREALRVCVFDVHPWARRMPARDAAVRARGLVYATETLLDTPAFRGRIRTAFPCGFTVRDVPLGMGEMGGRGKGGAGGGQARACAGGEC
ncbi:hypothetical protein GSI_03581 [Ganoderma sinense ZZ0214-1]|uniref:Uncharacterized protein n=1 Tax=Ganoderma sinense ZZ0214-1 TaxID=1077348 RepID=A0A2G8SJB9_9APHY|nr:hypothetical protein GSI_03581 [Ganoderma sinense ZZ0214-1]